MKKSWKTTAGGIVAILAPIFSAIKLMTDNDPTTNPDWNAVMAAVAAGVGLLFARDNNVSSEDAGAK